MKRTINVLLLGLLLVPVSSSRGQGTINFVTFNAIDGNLGIVYAVGGLVGVDSSFLGQLYVGSSPSSLSPVGSPVAFLDGAGRGYINGPTVTVTGIPGGPGTSAFYSLYAWNAAAGATYENAALNASGVIGQSGVQQIMPLGGGTPPNTALPSDANLHLAFTVAPVPEPAAVVFGLLGALAFMLRRKSA